MVDLNMKILIVDDYPQMRMVLKAMLTRMGFKNLHEAEEGRTALAKLKKEKFNLVLADWNMPIMSGLDLLKKAKEDEELKDTPFLMIAAEAEKENIVAAVQAGAAGYIVKPLSANTLEDKIKRIFA